MCTARVDSLIDPAAVVMQNWVDARVNRVLNHDIEVVLALQADHRYVKAKQKQCNQGKSRMTQQACFDAALAGRHGNLHEGMHVWARKGRALSAGIAPWRFERGIPCGGCNTFLGRRVSRQMLTCLGAPGTFTVVILCG